MFLCMRQREEGQISGKGEVLTPSLFCPVLASISCRARTDRDCSNTKLQIHRSGGTYCRMEEKEREGRREGGSEKRTIKGW